MSKSPAVKAAQKQNQDADMERVLKSGARIRICRVSQLLIDEAVNEVKEPNVPTYFDEDRQITLPNPDSAQYKKDIAEYERAQFRATFDAALLWGIELVDGVPEDDTWIKKLRFFAKRNKQVDIDQYDLDDELEREFAYKKFIAVDADELTEFMELMFQGVTEEDKEKARNLFPGDETRESDS